MSKNEQKPPSVDKTSGAPRLAGWQIVGADGCFTFFYFFLRNCFTFFTFFFYFFIKNLIAWGGQDFLNFWEIQISKKKIQVQNFLHFSWENKKITGANFCTDRQTMEYFRELLMDFQRVKASLLCHYAI